LSHRLRRLPNPFACEGETLDTIHVNQREAWFVEGATALRRRLKAMGMPDALPPDGQFYACPSCLMTYGRDEFNRGVFTYEHVPPRRLGGRPLVLTCQNCNNEAGTAMDAHAARREAVSTIPTERSCCPSCQGKQCA
jgi:hypothetical protein